MSHTSACSECSPVAVANSLSDRLSWSPSLQAEALRRKRRKIFRSLPAGGACEKTSGLPICIRARKNSSRQEMMMSQAHSTVEKWRENNSNVSDVSVFVFFSFATSVSRTHTDQPLAVTIWPIGWRHKVGARRMLRMTNGPLFDFCVCKTALGENVPLFSHSKPTLGVFFKRWLRKERPDREKTERWQGEKTERRQREDRGKTQRGHAERSTQAVSQEKNALWEMTTETASSVGTHTNYTNYQFKQQKMCASADSTRLIMAYVCVNDELPIQERSKEAKQYLCFSSITIQLLAIGLS